MEASWIPRPPPLGGAASGAATLHKLLKAARGRWLDEDDDGNFGPGLAHSARPGPLLKKLFLIFGSVLVYLGLLQFSFIVFGLFKFAASIRYNVAFESLGFKPTTFYLGEYNYAA